VTGRSHGKLGRFAAHDLAGRGCDQPRRTQFRYKVRWDEWYERCCFL